MKINEILTLNFNGLCVRFLTRYSLKKTMSNPTDFSQATIIMTLKLLLQ